MHRPVRPAHRDLPSFALFGDFVADDATNNGTADGAYGATAGQDGTTDGSDAGTDGGALPLRRHAGTGPQSKQGGGNQCCELDSLNGFHGISSF
jgi:hypothetical protein